MRIVKLILGILVMAVIITFIISNNEQQAAVKFLNWSSSNLPIWIICILAALAGFVLNFLIIHAPGSIKLNARIKSLNREIKKLTGELDRLRNAGLEDEVVDEIAAEESKPEIQEASENETGA